MFERKPPTEKSRKHSSIVCQKTLQFHKLFLNAEVTLPSQLQHFLSEGLRFPDNDGSRNTSNKIRVVLKINECRDTPSCLVVNKSQNCVGVIDPTPSRRIQTSNTSVNHFPFDSILTDTDSPNFLFTDALVDPMLDFIKGKDSCIFSFGHSGLGKTKSMIGFDQSIYNIGIIPCALVWTFKLIDTLKQNTNKRYSVRLSAMEVTSSDSVRDLLVNNAPSKPMIDQRSLGTSVADKSISVFNNQRELPAATLLEAAHILDKALAVRSTDNESLTHMQLIIHLYQYRVDASSADGGIESTNVVKGERSRLFLLDLGSGRHGSEDQKMLSLQGMSKVILALFTSQRHIPYKENVLTQLLKETLNPNISSTMMLHISSKEQNYSETLQVVQLAYKLHRMRLKKYRSVGLSVSDEASSCSSSSSSFQSRRLRPHMGIGAARRSSGNSSASSEFELTSASEMSCCETVIFKGDTAGGSLSDKSPDRMSSRRKLRSVSSESDNAFSDKDNRSPPFSSGSIMSPSIIRKRRTSPRTNARAWPSSNESSGIGLESGSELWVDGPNAVYKVEKVEIEPKPNFIKPQNNVESISKEIILKPLMISKETQCDDIWDSGSSITDGSSHSNTLDRKDHRPLSDISECTEETESNLAVESELVKMNLMDHIEPTNDLDDFFESSFGLSPMGQENQFKPFGQVFLSPHIQLMEKIVKPTEQTISKSINELRPESKENQPIVDIVVQKPPLRRHSSDTKKHCHSASDSRRSAKSESRGKRSKTKCKSCSRKANDTRSKSMTSSSSTDFSRVASWIENVENEIQSTKNDKVYNVGNNNMQIHHHSQPDISYRWDMPNVYRPNFNAIHQPYPLPNNDCHQAHYSLYDGYKMTLPKAESIPAPSSSRTNTFLPPPPPIITQISSVPHMVTNHDPPIDQYSYPYSPVTRRAYPRSSNISLPINTVSANQLPLPPLPKSALYVDTRVVSSTEILNHPCSYNRPLPVSPVPISAATNPKCKTLPRDMYSEVDSIIKRSKDKLPPKTHQGRLEVNELKLKDKSKKESKNLMRILFAPLISLRKKINKNKAALESTTSKSEPDSDQYAEKRSNSSLHQLGQWSSVKHNMEPNIVLTSPYQLVTPPKTAILPTESSGHGSDCSSFHNREPVKSKPSDHSHRHKNRNGSTTHSSKYLPRQRPTSSGYGSSIMKGDSEVSSHNDSSSEYSLSGLNNSKAVGCHSRMKHSISLSNYKSIHDANSSNVSKSGSPEIRHPSCSTAQDSVFHNVKIAEDLIIQEKLKMSLKEERKIVIDLIETNRLRGVPVDATVMDLICFKCKDNFSITSSSKRNECEQLIKKIDHEIELLKQKLRHAQHHLNLITSFDSNPQSQ